MFHQYLTATISRYPSPKPILPGANIKLGDYLEIGMKLRVLVQARIDKKSGLPSGYYDFIPASIKPAGSLSIQKDATTPPTKPLPDASNLQNALFIVKGCKDSIEALQRLSTAPEIATDVIQAFLVADKNKAVEYPIK